MFKKRHWIWEEQDPLAWLTELSKRSGGIRTETVQQGHKNPGKSKNSFCWVIQLYMWALPHQHQPAAPFRSETPTNLTCVYRDISKAVGKLMSSLLLFMFISTKLLLQLTPREPPLHSVLSHFHSDCKNSHWAESFPLSSARTGQIPFQVLSGLEVPSHWWGTFAMSSRDHLPSQTAQRSAQECEQWCDDLTRK